MGLPTNRYKRNPFGNIHAAVPDPWRSEYGIYTQSVVFIRVENKEGVGEWWQTAQQDMSSGQQCAYKGCPDGDHRSKAKFLNGQVAAGFAFVEPERLHSLRHT